VEDDTGGGLNYGGKGYYALDITDPASPSLLWEFTHANLGYSYGEPKITKLKNGTWVVLVSSGYNNADGVGHLFVINAKTGSLIRTIDTGVGTPTNPSGLARISAYGLTPLTDNVTVAAYGGDLFGNLWRFDVNNDIGVAGYDAFRLVTFMDKENPTVPQPITARPVEATVNNSPIIYIDTGRYLGRLDITDSSKHTFYAIKDKMDATTHYADPHTEGSGFIEQTLTSTGLCPTGVTFCGDTVLKVTNNTVDLTSASVNGWYIDFLNAGERGNSDPTINLGTLIFTTIKPEVTHADPCLVGNGTSYLYALNYLTGSSMAGTRESAVSLSV